ncbi:MAG: hypothetical protein J0H10_11015 [Alphaproteobacteria bacterium]|nr:hypothetical protein [Alphaproteobacteria bacterium]
MNRTLLAVCVAGLFVVAATFASPHSSSTEEAERPTFTALPVNPAHMDAVTRYVEKTRGWKKDQYTISLRHKDGKLWHFWVYFKGAHTPGSVGNDGKSFDAVLNIDTHRVEKELHFQ